MLDKIIYLGYEISEISFSSKLPNIGEGYFDVKITSSAENVYVRRDLNKDEDGYVLAYPSQVNITGFENEGDNKTEVFSLSFVTESLFKFPDDLTDYQDLVKNNIWFFDNFASIDIASTTEALLKNTQYSGVKLSKRRE